MDNAKQIDRPGPEFPGGPADDARLPTGQALAQLPILIVKKRAPFGPGFIGV